VRIAVEQRVREQTGLSLQKDVENALGDVAAFEAGVRPGRRAGAVVVQTDDPERSATRWRTTPSSSGDGTRA